MNTRGVEEAWHPPDDAPVTFAPSRYDAATMKQMNEERKAKRQAVKVQQQPAWAGRPMGLPASNNAPPRLPPNLPHPNLRANMARPVAPPQAGYGAQQNMANMGQLPFHNQQGPPPYAVQQQQYPNQLQQQSMPPRQHPHQQYPNQRIQPSFPPQLPGHIPPYPPPNTYQNNAPQQQQQYQQRIPPTQTYRPGGFQNNNMPPQRSRTSLPAGGASLPFSLRGGVPLPKGIALAGSVSGSGAKRSMPIPTGPSGDGGRKKARREEEVEEGEVSD
jgi:hypothetical protein